MTLPDGPFYPGCECKDECRINCSCVAKYGPAYEINNDILVMAHSSTQLNSNGKGYKPCNLILREDI